MMENKKTESNEDVKTFMFSHKIHRILCYFSLISIPCLFVPLVYSFNVFGLIGVILISILMIFLCYWYNTYKLILYNDKFVLQNILYTFYHQILYQLTYKTGKTAQSYYFFLNYANIFHILSFFIFSADRRAKKKSKYMI